MTCPPCLVFLRSIASTVLLCVAGVGFEGRQSEETAVPSGGEHPPGAREGSAPQSEVTIDEALDVEGIGRSGWMLMGGECLKSLRLSEGILR